MAVIHTDRYNANVEQVLIDKDVMNSAGMSTSQSAKAGIEIETGWTSEAKRKSFFKALEKAGVDSQCISKHDGSISGDFPAEIVSVPMPLDELAKFARKVGEAIESKSDKGLITQGCGVHIHLSEGMFSDNTLWRYAASVCQDPSAILTWINAPQTDGETNEITSNLSDSVRCFWDAVCLRKAGNYSQRSPYFSTGAIRRSVSHSLAIIHGTRTPTFETRIFRTAKSRRVLESYVEAVKSLYDFSFNPGDDHLEVGSAGPQTDLAQLAKEVTPLLTPYRTTMGGYYWMTDMGDILGSSDIQIVYGTNASYRVPTAAAAARMGRRVPTVGELELLSQGTPEGKGARGWVEGTIPLKAYITYVLNNPEKYPCLSQRFGYSRFQAFLGGPPEEETWEHRAIPHLEFQRGCLVRTEGNRGQTFTIMSVGDEVLNLTGPTGARTEPIGLVNHACKGALETGGEV